METWKQVDGFNGRYKVSTYGRIKSFAQDKINGKIKIGNLDHNGYRTILLYNGKGGKKRYFVHRLVAQAFIPNPSNLPQVNHMDENKENNRVENLEWCDNDYNINYGTGRERAAMSNYCCETTSKRVYSVDTKTGQIEYFDSIGEAERKTGNSHCNIVRALKGRRPRCGGRQWFYCY